MKNRITVILLILTASALYGAENPEMATAVMPPEDNFITVHPTPGTQFPIRRTPSNKRNLMFIKTQGEYIPEDSMNEFND